MGIRRPPNSWLDRFTNCCSQREDNKTYHSVSARLHFPTNIDEIK